jgi:folate-dependent phosphoribosylglycinamide formyltransferase PurN
MLNLFDDVRIAVFCSHRAPGLDRLLHHPQRSRMYDVACVVTSEPAIASRSAIEDAGAPVLIHPIRRFHDECGAPIRDMDARRAYDALTVHVLEQLDVNVVLMLGYLYIASDVLLNAFRGRIFNIHDGEPRYPGLHATFDAVVAGEPVTYSTLHHVTSTLDGGPIVLQSKPYPVAPFVRDAMLGGHVDIVKAYAYAQREWMMRDSWGDLAVRAMEMVAAGTYEEVAV